MAAPANGAEVHEDILPAIAGDEAVALVDVEPLHLAELAVIALDLGQVDQLRGEHIDRQSAEQQQQEDRHGRGGVDHGDAADGEALEQRLGEGAAGQVDEQGDQQRRRGGEQQADQDATKHDLAIHGLE